MKLKIASIAFAATFAAASAHAHFLLVYTPETMLEKPAEISLDLVFGHPMENGHTMDMEPVQEFFVMFKGKRTDLKDGLKAIEWQGAHNTAKAFDTTFKIRRNGDYTFVAVPDPYYEEGEDIYIQQITKMVVNKGAFPTDWSEPLGLATEIVPLNKPYQNYVGGTFTGRVLSSGQPAAGVECEIEYINTMVDTEGNAFGKDNLGDVPPSAFATITDSNGMFVFGIPKAGRWGFACLGSGPLTEYEGKEMSQDAVLWIDAVELN
jgi:cobalt/nickel transport protein